MYKKNIFHLAPLCLSITSYFGFLLAALTITSALFIGLSKIRLI
uniref:Cytochrome b6-f complex subunit 6 n=1 Tax=Eleutherococcus brachypus TaxID=2291122 RepID=A0A7H1CMM1_9APIA|nr:cytochrome b6/f complex subunit VI [Eleutherococcus brachypus]QNS22510.1 cytochrome b6/f complex subunit VI [Eleutherococcus brachypus]